MGKLLCLQATELPLLFAGLSGNGTVWISDPRRTEQRNSDCPVTLLSLHPAPRDFCSSRAAL